ncbi:MAG: PilZ domain-containing protein [Pseudolabrys sp.]|nr:PilZ domain-containing protein [Pseudolabrys sp.]
MKQRVHARHRVLKAGTIEFGGGAIDCTVRNMSVGGAALDVISPLGIPERFLLVIRADEFSKSARMVWHKENRIGIVFE